MGMPLLFDTCLSDGESQIKVVVSEQAEATSLKTFRYKATANVSWVAGVGCWRV